MYTREEPGGAGGRRAKETMGGRRVLLCGLLYVLLAVSLQWLSGAFDGTWTNEPDEASHFLNGLMVHDYLRHGLGEHPLRYAERYYQHYPRIALGHFPPLFAAVEGVWFLIAPISYASALVMVGLLAASVGMGVAWICARWFPFPLAFGSGLAWLLLPITRRGTEAFMAEMLLTLTILLAVIGFSRHRLTFGFWSGMALLTKGSGMALALLPPCATLLSRRWGEMGRTWLWLSAAMVIAMAGPWYALAPDALHEKVRVYGGYAPKPLERLLALPGFFWWSMGPMLCALAMFGLVVFWRKHRADALWLALAALIPGALLLRISVAVWESRHLVLTVPGLVCLAALGFHHVAGRAPAGWPRRMAIGALLAAVAISLAIAQRPRAALHGPAEIADAIPTGATVLVSATTPMEGAVIAELAIRDPRRPSRMVFRGSKSLASWNSRSQVFEPFFENPREAGEILRRLGVEAVAVDIHSIELHNRRLERYLRESPEEWRLADTFGGRIALYLRAR